MKVSELIQHLESFRQAHGDFDVYISQFIAQPEKLLDKIIYRFGAPQNDDPRLDPQFHHEEIKEGLYLG